jgi:hypothetical protein
MSEFRDGVNWPPPGKPRPGNEVPAGVDADERGDEVGAQHGDRAGAFVAVGGVERGDAGDLADRSRDQIAAARPA